LNETILIVEDDKNTQILYRDLADLVGLKTITCESGEMAVLRYVEYMPCLVIMDLDLEKMSGCKAIWQIKEYDITAKIIIITGEKTPNQECITMQKMYKLPFLVKPISVEQILKIMQSVH